MRGLARQTGLSLCPENPQRTGLAQVVGHTLDRPDLQEKVWGGMQKLSWSPFGGAIGKGHREIIATQSAEEAEDWSVYVRCGCCL